MYSSASVSEKMSKRFSGILFEGITSKIQLFEIRNEHDLAVDVVPVLHSDATPQMLFPLVYFVPTIFAFEFRKLPMFLVGAFSFKGKMPDS